MKASEILEFIKNLDLEKYFYENNLGKLMGINKITKPKILGPWATSESTGSEVFLPEGADLTRLHAIVRKRKIINVLEFGSGRSTKIIASALKLNKLDYSEQISKIRRKNPFHVCSIESEKKYAIEAEEVCKLEGLEEFVTVFLTPAEQISYKGFICGKYKSIPSYCPDLIYIDGPMPMSYKNGPDQYMNLNHSEITNITCDILILEPILLPGTIVIIDGMTNNSRFIRRNLQRRWSSFEDLKNDYTVLILDEEPLGIHHINQLRFQNS